MTENQFKFAAQLYGTWLKINKSEIYDARELSIYIYLMLLMTLLSLQIDSLLKLFQLKNGWLRFSYNSVQLNRFWLITTELTWKLPVNKHKIYYSHFNPSLITLNISFFIIKTLNYYLVLLNTSLIHVNSLSFK